MKELYNELKKNKVLILKGIKSGEKRDFFQELQNEYSNIIYSSSSEIGVNYYHEKLGIHGKIPNKLIGVLKSDSNILNDYDLIIYDRFEEDSLDFHKIFKLWDQRFTLYQENPKLLLLTNSNVIPYLEDVKILNIEDKISYNFIYTEYSKNTNGKNIYILEDYSYNNVDINKSLDSDDLDYFLNTKDPCSISIKRKDFLSLDFKFVENIYDSCREEFFMKSNLNKETISTRPVSIENIKNIFNFATPLNYYVSLNIKDLQKINEPELMTRDLTKYNIDLGEDLPKIIKNSYFNTNKDFNYLTDFGIFSMYYELSIRNCGILYETKCLEFSTIVSTSISDSKFEDCIEICDAVEEIKNVKFNNHPNKNYKNLMILIDNLASKLNIRQEIFDSKETIENLIPLYMKYFYDSVYTYNNDKYVNNDNKIFQNDCIGNKIIVLDYNEKITLYINLDKYS